MREAAERGHSGAVEVLMKDPRTDAPTAGFTALCAAAEHGDEECSEYIVEFILQDPRVDVAAENSRALRLGVDSGDDRVIRLMLEDGRFDASAEDNYAIISAARNGHVELVAMLLDARGVNPAARNCRALQSAIRRRHSDIVLLLMADARVVRHPWTRSNLHRLTRKQLREAQTTLREAAWYRRRHAIAAYHAAGLLYDN